MACGPFAYFTKTMSSQAAPLLSPAEQLAIERASQEIPVKEDAYDLSTYPDLVVTGETPEFEVEDSNQTT